LTEAAFTASHTLTDVENALEYTSYGKAQAAGMDFRRQLDTSPTRTQPHKEETAVPSTCVAVFNSSYVFCKAARAKLQRFTPSDLMAHAAGVAQGVPPETAEAEAPLETSSHCLATLVLLSA